MIQEGSGQAGYSGENAFIEAHYYDGGLRHQAIATSAGRPKWAPTADFVGFRDEIKLQADDFAVEIVKFRSKASSVAWLGVYRLSPDAKFGNRNNHVGVGLWLRDLFPHDGEVLIDGLFSLLTKLRDDPFDEFAESSRKFLNGFLIKVVSPYTQLAEPLAGMIPAKSKAHGTIGLDVPRNDAFQDRLNNAVYRAFFLDPSHREASRLLLHIHSGKGAFGVIAKDDFSAEVVRVLPAAFSQQAEMLDDVKAAYAQLEAERDKLDATVEKLEAERRNLSDNLTMALREHEELRRAVEDDDQLKRFSQLNDGLKEIRRSIVVVERSLPDMQRNLAREFQSAVNTVLQSSGHLYKSPIDPILRKPEPTPRSGDLNWVLIVPLVLCFITIVAGGVYLIYRLLVP